MSATSSLLGHNLSPAMAPSASDVEDGGEASSLRDSYRYHQRAEEGSGLNKHTTTQHTHISLSWLRLAGGQSPNPYTSAASADFSIRLATDCLRPSLNDLFRDVFVVVSLSALLGIVLTVTMLTVFASSGLALLSFPLSSALGSSWQLFSSSLLSPEPSLSLSSFSPSSSTSSSSSTPVLSRGAFLFLCATQDEANRYMLAMPAVVADVYIYCWKKTCTLDAIHAARTAANLSAYDTTAMYVSPWTSAPHSTITMRNGRHHTHFSRHTDLLVVPETALATGSQHGNTAAALSAYAVPSSYPAPASVADEFYRVVPSVSVFNEREAMGSDKNSTWNSGRNFLLNAAHEYESLSGWRYAYINFADGDVKLTCARFQSLVRTGQPLQAIAGTYSDSGRLDSYIPQFLHWWHITQHTNPADAYSLIDGLEVTCWLGYFASLLTAAPAMGTFHNVYSPTYGAPTEFDASVAWSYDAILSSFQADAVSLFLPYCQRWDELSWWASQSVVANRGVCTLGHALYINHITVDPSFFTHQPYAKKVDPWVTVEEAQSELHTVPKTLLGVQRAIGKNSTIGEVMLVEYGGWHSGLVSHECQTRMADPLSCVWVST